MTFEWTGVFPAVLTPFTSNDELDLELFKKNFHFQIDAGIHGVIIGGSLGEASVLETNEKERLVNTALEVADQKIPIILNIAEGSTREALKQASLASKWKADGLMLLPPMRYKSDERETIVHFKSIADSTNLPILIYNNPVDYKIDVTPDMFEELLLNCPNIEAVKESTRDVTNITRLINRFGKRLKILCGVDTLALEELYLGADGWVAGLVNAFPQETMAIYHLVKAGRIEEATKIYRWFMPLLELDIHPKLVQYIKLAASQNGLGSEYVRAPRLTLQGKERDRVLAVIMEGIKNRPVVGVEKLIR